MRKNKFKYFIKNHIHTSLFIVLLVIGVILGVVVNNSKHFEALGTYGSPQCKIDYAWFEGETCEKCENSIMNTGAIKALDGKSPAVSFSDYYESYADYKTSHDKILIPAFGILFCFILIIIDFLHFIYESISERHLKNGKKVKK